MASPCHAVHNGSLCSIAQRATLATCCPPGRWVASGLRLAPEAHQALEHLAIINNSQSQDDMSVITSGGTVVAGQRDGQWLSGG